MGDIFSETGNNVQAIDFYNKALSCITSNSNNTYRSEIIFKQARAQWFAGYRGLALNSVINLTSDLPRQWAFLRFSWGDAC